MTASIGDSWDRIEVWLAERAPATFAGLEPPADPEEIVAAEAAIGLPFPDALRQSLLRHNGTGHHDLLAPFWKLSSTQDIADDWEVNVSVHADLPAPDNEEDDGDPEADTGPWWHRKWIPFAADGGGGLLVIDQRPTFLQGRIGCAYKEDGGCSGRHAMEASLPTLFEMTATSLETGGRLDSSYQRLVSEQGELDWEILLRPAHPDGPWRGRGRRPPS